MPGLGMFFPHLMGGREGVLSMLSRHHLAPRGRGT